MLDLSRGSHISGLPFSPQRVSFTCMSGAHVCSLAVLMFFPPAMTPAARLRLSRMLPGWGPRDVRPWLSSGQNRRENTLKTSVEITASFRLFRVEHLWNKLLFFYYSVFLSITTELKPFSVGVRKRKKDKVNEGNRRYHAASYVLGHCICSCSKLPSLNNVSTDWLNNVNQYACH